ADPALPALDNARLQKAVEHADNVISSGKYSLLADFTKLFGRANESKAPEHVITIHHDGDNIDAQGNHQTHCAFTFPFELEKDNHMGPADVTLYERWEQVDPADAVRREWSYTTYVENPENNKGYNYVPPVTLARYGKGIDRSYENSVNHAITTNEVDRIELRYAEVLLIKAEALFQLGQNAEALATLNQVRERAGATPLTAVTFNDVKREWSYEFVYEQKHWLNLVRWRTLIATVKTVSTFKYFDDSYAVAGGTGQDGEIVSSFFAKVHKHLHAKYDNVRGQHYRFPIPTGLEGEDLHITPQNPGY
ncbi:MAG: RagB/SusD family nutrient uptake outer membrane protein, partial [Tannerellaceae bacterium]|nr:RagB/SusD family nutrient uptake outer membrane protein [Tannerellaceae bacterium]